MKRKFFTLLLLFPLWGLGVLLWGCSDDDDNASQNPVAQLPEATQEGRNTVGCLVDGEVFLPKGGGLSGNTNCFYQYVDGEFNFRVGYLHIINNRTLSVTVGTQSAEITEGEVYILNKKILYGEAELGRGAGFSCRNYNESIEDLYSTTSEVTGELEITKLDTQNGIVSGTFWFDAVNAEGDLVEIREGRFDMLYTD